VRGFQGGFLTIGRWRQVLFRVHWATPLVLFAFGRFRFVPVFWAAFLVLTLVHELGHAAIVRWIRAQVIAIDFLPAGGVCRWAGEASPIQRACIAWGGVWAQLVVLAAALGWQWVFGLPRSYAGAQILDACIAGNLWAMAFNLLPIRPLDGHRAWALFPLLVAHVRTRRARRRREAMRTNLDELRRRDLAEEDQLSAPPPEAKALVDSFLKDVKGKPPRRN
jgi:Zn-dependent protease